MSRQLKKQQSVCFLWLFRWTILTVVIINVAINNLDGHILLNDYSTTTPSTSSVFFVEGRPNFPECGDIPKIATIASQRFSLFNGKKEKQPRHEGRGRLRQQQQISSLLDLSDTSRFGDDESFDVFTSSSSSTSTKSPATMKPRRPFLSVSRRLSLRSSLSQHPVNRTTKKEAITAPTSIASTAETSSRKKGRLYNKHSASAVFDNIKEDFRGGAAVAAENAVKTMTARRMETFKFLSGGVAGTVAACITNPLEVIKTQLQSSNKELLKAKGQPVQIARTIMEQDGIPGFFRGLPPTLVGIIPSRSAYFYAYQRMKTFLHPKFPEGSPPNALIAGFMAGIVGNTLTNPIWMVRTRMQLLIDHTAGQRAYTGYGDAIMTIFREEGIGGFYKGITASYWGCAEGALQFIIYEQIKTKLIDRQNKVRATKGLPPTSELPKATYFWAAAASKCVAAVATYPHEVARTRMREQARAGIFKYKGMWNTIGVMAKEEGMKSLYSGMGVHLVKVVPNSALMFLTYEIVRSWLDGYEIVENRVLEGMDG